MSIDTVRGFLNSTVSSEVRVSLMHALSAEELHEFKVQLPEGWDITELSEYPHTYKIRYTN